MKKTTMVPETSLLMISRWATTAQPQKGNEEEGEGRWDNQERYVVHAVDHHHLLLITIRLVVDNGTAATPYVTRYAYPTTHPNLHTTCWLAGRLITTSPHQGMHAYSQIPSCTTTATSPLPAITLSLCNHHHHHHHPTTLTMPTSHQSSPSNAKSKCMHHCFVKHNL